jgi:hypothetical protein
LAASFWKEPQYTVDRLRTPYGRTEEEKHFLILLAFEPQVLGILALRLVTMQRSKEQGELNDMKV